MSSYFEQYLSMVNEASLDLDEFGTVDNIVFDYVFPVWDGEELVDEINVKGGSAEDIIKKLQAKLGPEQLTENVKKQIRTEIAQKLQRFAMEVTHQRKHNKNPHGMADYDKVKFN